MKGKLFGILLWIGFVAVSVYMVYPYFMDALLGIDHVTTIGAYDAAVAAKDTKAIDAMWEAAWEYNKKVAKRQQQHAFSYMGADATDDTYEALLTFDGNGTMGSVQVPTADIDLPIAHGTKNESLDIQAGHVYGSSLPVGGEGSHAIIAGHTGLRNADIFTHLEKVREGDEFYISVLNKRLAYKVVRILVVLPTEENPYLQVEPGRDLVTLYTCTPYGVNSHRLLVMGERDKSMEASGARDGQSEGVTVTNRDFKALLRCILFGAIPFAVAVVAWLLVFGKKKKKKDADGGTNAAEVPPVPEIPPESADDWFCTLETGDAGNPRKRKGKRQ